MSEDRIAKYAVAGVSALVGIAYLVWLSVLYIKFVQTDAFLRAQILEHYGERHEHGEPDSDNPVSDRDNSDTDPGPDIPDGDKVDAN